jgi:hypothetical protein
VNVNTTDATVGATALLLPAQNTHTLHDPKRGTEHARAGGVEDGLGVGGLDGGGDVCVSKQACLLACRVCPGSPRYLLNCLTDYHPLPGSRGPAPPGVFIFSYGLGRG